MKIQLDLDLPPGLVDKELEHELMSLVKEDVVLRLFEQGKIPSGLATSLLRLTRRQFIELCQQRGIALADYTAEDLQQDLAVMDKLMRKKEAEPAGEDRRE